MKQAICIKDPESFRNTISMNSPLYIIGSKYNYTKIYILNDIKYVELYSLGVYISYISYTLFKVCFIELQQHRENLINQLMS